MLIEEVHQKSPVTSGTSCSWVVGQGPERDSSRTVYVSISIPKGDRIFEDEGALEAEK